MARMRKAASAAAILLMASGASAQETEQDLAKQLANPVANLVSVPFQWNYDCCFGTEDASRVTLNIQPVIPFELDNDWTLVTRTIIPVIYQEEPIAGLGIGDKAGLSDIVQSFFFAPPGLAEGVTFGAGPVLLYPTATEPELGGEKWGAGPTAVILKQEGPWTYGFLGSHLWSYAGAEDREDVSATGLQPFLAYNFPDSTSLSLNFDSTYNWVSEDWTVPMNVGVSKLFDFGGQKVSLGLSGRAYLETPPGGPEYALRFTSTFLFPRSMQR